MESVMEPGSGDLVKPSAKGEQRQALAGTQETQLFLILA